MKRLTATTLFCLLFFSAFVAGKGPAETPGYPDSLRSVWLYTEGIKQNIIAGDTARARELFLEAVRNDSTYAPAWYELAGNLLNSSPEEAVEMARRAYRLDTANKWYHQFYGQALIISNRLDEALKVYRRLLENDPKDPDNYRIVAALYEQKRSPFMALATLDSAELRFGRIPLLSAMKRQMLVATNQIGKAIDEARAMVEAAPYEAQHHVVLADLYGLDGKDSLALAEYGRALQIDSTNVQTLMSLADFHTGRQDYRSLLAVTRKLFLSDALPLETKIKRFEQFTSDTRFYREYYFQLNDLASILAIRYPEDRRVVELYANHLIASGELEQALTLYKSRLGDRPPVEDFYRTVIDIETYLQHPDSVEKYVGKALELFPDKVDFHISKGHVMNSSKQYGQAVKAYKESLRYADTDSLRGVIWGMIGDTWHQQAAAGISEQRREPHGEGGPFGTLPQGHEGVLQGLRAQSRVPSRQPIGAQQLRLFPLAGGARSRTGSFDVEPRGGAHRQQSDLSGHPCVGAFQAGTHGRSQEGPAKGRGARRAEESRTDGPLRRHPSRTGRTVHGRNLLETRPRKGLRRPTDRTAAETARQKLQNRRITRHETLPHTDPRLPALRLCGRRPARQPHRGAEKGHRGPRKADRLRGAGDLQAPKRAARPPKSGSAVWRVRSTPGTSCSTKPRSRPACCARR